MVDPIDNLQEVHESYVTTPIEQTTWNFAFICKRYFVHFVINELGLEHNVTKLRRFYEKNN